MNKIFDVFRIKHFNEIYLYFKNYFICYDVENSVSNVFIKKRLNI